MKNKQKLIKFKEEEDLKKVLALLLAVTVGFASVACGSSANALAVVDGKEVTKTDYENYLKYYKWVMTQQYGDNVWDQMTKQDPNFETTTKSQLLDAVVQNQIVANYAEKNDIKANKDQIKSFDESLKKLLADKKAKESLEKAGLTEDMLKKYGEQAALMTAFNEFVSKKATPSEEEIKKVYETRKVTVDASHILLKTTDDKGAALSDEKKAEVKKKADELYEKAKGGEDFAKLSKENSQDPGTASKGGALGEFSKGHMVKEFENAAFSLKDGEISKPVLTQYGYHIIKLNKKITKKYEDLKESIKTELTQTKTQELVQKIQQSAKITKNTDKLKDIVLIEKKAETKKEEKKTEDKSSTEKKEEKKTEEK